MSKKQKVNRSALIKMIIFLLIIFGALFYVFRNEILQSLSSKAVHSGIVIKKNIFNEDPSLGNSSGRLSRTMYSVTIRLDNNVGVVTSGKQDIYNKAELDQKYFVLWRNFDNEILDIALNEASLNFESDDDLPVFELLLTTGIVVIFIVFMLYRTLRKTK